MADLIFSLGSLVFIVALIPSLRSSQKPALGTCIMTGTVLAVFASTYIGIGLYYAAATTAITASMWLTLAIQNHKGKQCL